MPAPRPGTDPTWATDVDYAAGADPWSATPTRVEPDAGDKASGLVPGTRAPAQWLNWALGLWADWLAYLRDERDRLDTYCDDFGVQLPAAVQPSRYIGPECAEARYDSVAGKETWAGRNVGVGGDLFEGAKRSEIDSGELYIDLTPRLVRNGTLAHVRVLVKPGAARAGANRMQAALLGVDFGASFAAPAIVRSSVGAAVYDDGTTNEQWLHIDLTPAGVAVTTHALWRLYLYAGNDGATNHDYFYAVEVEVASSTIRND